MMGPLEIIVIVACSLFVFAVFGRYIYKKIKRIPTGTCSECHTLTGKELVKEYRKAYGVCGNKCCEKKKNNPN